MASPRYLWIALFLLSWRIGVSGRAVSPRGLLAQSGQTLRTDAQRRWRRGVAETRCAELAAPWQENAGPGQEDTASLLLLLQLRAPPFTQRSSQGVVFPGKPLFSFVRRVYRCCQDGLSCRSVRGIQGRLRGGTDVEFLLSGENLSLPVTRAELHLQLSNPQRLDILPELSALSKRGLPTRYSLWSRGNTVELRLELLFFLQALQEKAGEAGGGQSLANIRQVVFSPRGGLQGPDGVVLDLGLVLGCSQAGSGVSCGAGGVHLLHTPFMALYYR